MSVPVFKKPDRLITLIPVKLPQQISHKYIKPHINSVMPLIKKMEVASSLIIPTEELTRKMDRIMRSQRTSVSGI